MFEVRRYKDELPARFFFWEKQYIYI